MITDNVSLRPDHKAIQLTGMTYNMGMAMPNGREKSIQQYARDKGEDGYEADKPRKDAQ